MGSASAMNIDLSQFSNSQLIQMIHVLTTDNSKLQLKIDKLQHLYKIDEARTKVSPQMEPHSWHLYHNPLNHYYSHYQDCKAITITFDPSKFSYHFSNSELINYFFNTLADIIDTKQDQIYLIYGTIEQHKSEVPHFHFLINTSISKFSLEETLKPFFTDNINNNKAVLVKDVKDDGWVQYINKKEEYKKYYFEYKKDGWLLPPLAPSCSNKDKINILQDRLNKINDITYITILRRDYNRLKTMEKDFYAQKNL